MAFLRTLKTHIATAARKGETSRSTHMQHTLAAQPRSHAPAQLIPRHVHDASLSPIDAHDTHSLVVPLPSPVVCVCVVARKLTCSSKKAAQVESTYDHTLVKASNTCDVTPAVIASITELSIIIVCDTVEVEASPVSTPRDIIIVSEPVTVTCDVIPTAEMSQEEAKAALDAACAEESSTEADYGTYVDNSTRTECESRPTSSDN